MNVNRALALLGTALAVATVFLFMGDGGLGRPGESALRDAVGQSSTPTAPRGLREPVRKPMDRAEREPETVHHVWAEHRWSSVLPVRPDFRVVELTRRLSSESARVGRSLRRRHNARREHDCSATCGPRASWGSRKIRSAVRRSSSVSISHQRPSSK